MICFAHCQSGQAIKLVVWEGYHIDNTVSCLIDLYCSHSQQWVKPRDTRHGKHDSCVARSIKGFSPPVNDNPFNSFKECLEVIQNEKAISKLANGERGLQQGSIIFLTLSTLYKGIWKCLCYWEVMWLLASRKQGLLQGCAILLALPSHYMGVWKCIHNWEALSWLKIPVQGVPAGCPTVAPLSTIYKFVLMCLLNREVITTLANGQQGVWKDVSYYWHFRYFFQCVQQERALIFYRAQPSSTLLGPVIWKNV